MQTQWARACAALMIAGAVINLARQTGMDSAHAVVTGVVLAAGLFVLTQSKS